MAVIGQMLRGRSRARFVGVTGSTGKTSTKDILAALCSAVAPTVWTEGSYNAELGVPLTLGRLEPETEICIVEMGMRGFGQIADLCEIVRPHVGVISAVGPVHLELVGSVDGVARSKAELVSALPPDGIAVVPESADLEPYLRTDIEILRVPPVDVELREDGAHVAFGERRIRFPLTSRHQAQNALTALTAYEAMDLPLDRLEEGAAGVELSKWRGEELPLPGGGFVVNDAYNANPTSMEAALRHLAERGANRRRLAILGGMAELGDQAERHHREIAELADELGIELLAVGDLALAYRADALGAGCGLGARDGATARPAGRRRARQGVAFRCPRRHRPDPGERHAVMVRVFIAGLIAMVVSVVIGPKFIEFLRRNELGQPIREDGPAGHVVKQGTPVMGGLLILLCAVIPFLALSKFTLPALTVLFLTVSCAAVGFLDDFIKVRHRRSLGLQGRWKLILLAAITVVVGFAVHAQSQLDTSIYIPVVNVDIPLSYAYYPFLFLVIAGAANGANLTDGLDGLAAGVGIIALLTFLSINVIGYIRSGDVGARTDFLLDLAILAAALIGAAIGFLWYNAFPAELFMGDTGSMAFGGALAGFAIVTGTEALLLLIAGIYVDRGALRDHPDDELQVLGPPRLPDRADPPPLRDEGVVGDEDHGPLLDRRGDPRGLRLRPLLPLLPPVPALNRALVLGLARSGRAAQAALEAGGTEVVARRPDARERRGSLPARRRRGAGQEPGRAGRGSRSSSAARERGIPVWSEIELASRLLPNPIVGVTGTNGKTTTTELLGAMLGARTAGNVGTALSELVGDAARGRLDRLRALELPARGHRPLQAPDRGAAQPRAGPSRPARRLRGLPGRQAADLREPGRRRRRRRAARLRRRAGCGAPGRVRRPTTRCRPSR